MEVMRKLSGATDLDRLLRFWTKHTPEGSEGLPLDLFVQAFLHVFEKNGTFEREDVCMLRANEGAARAQHPRRWHFVLSVISALLEAFREIDVNGDSYIEWHELTAYIAYAGVIALKKTAGVYARGYFQERNVEWRDTAVDPRGSGVSDLFVVEWPFEYEGLLHSPTTSYYPHAGGKGPCRFDGTPAIDPTGAVDQGNQAGDSSRRALAMRHQPMELFVIEAGSSRLRILDAGSREAAPDRSREPIEGLRYMERLTATEAGGAGGKGGQAGGSSSTRGDAHESSGSSNSSPAGGAGRSDHHHGSYRAGFNGTGGGGSAGMAGGGSGTMDHRSRSNSKRTGPFADERGRRSIRYPGAVISSCSSLRFKYELRSDSPSIDAIARQEASRPSDVVALRRAAMTGDGSGPGSYGSADLQLAMVGISGSRVGVSPKVYMPSFEDTMRMLAPSAGLVASLSGHHGGTTGGMDAGLSGQGYRGGGLMTEALEAAAHLRRRRRLEQQGKQLGLLADSGSAAGQLGKGGRHGGKKGSRGAANRSKKQYQLKSLLRQTQKPPRGAGGTSAHGSGKPPRASEPETETSGPSINCVCPMLYQPHLNAARLQAGISPVPLGASSNASVPRATSKYQRKRMQQQLPPIERGVALGQSDGRITLWRLPKGCHIPISDSVFDPQGVEAARKSAEKAELASEVDDILMRGHRTGEVLAKVRALPEVMSDGSKIRRGGSAEQDTAIDDRVRERTDAALAYLMLDADATPDEESNGSILDSGGAASTRPVYRNPFVVFGVIPFRGPVAHLASALGLLYANGPAEPGVVYVYDIASRTHLHKIQAHPAPLTQMLAISPGSLGVAGPVRGGNGTAVEYDSGYDKNGHLEESKSLKQLEKTLRDVVSKQSSTSNAEFGPAALAEAFRHAGSLKPSLAKTDRALAVSDKDAAGRGLLVTASLDRTLSIRELAPSLDETRLLQQDKARHLVNKARQARALEQQRARRAAMAAATTPKSKAVATLSEFEDDDDGPRDETELEKEMRRQDEDRAVRYAAESIPLVSNGGREIARVTLPRACRYAIFVPTGNLLCVAGFDTEAWAFSLPSGKLALSLRGHHAPLVGIAELWHGREAFGLGGASWGYSPKPLFYGKRAQGGGGSGGGEGAYQGSGALPAYVEPRVVTVDEGGAFRVWDLTPVATGVAACIMTFSVYTATGSSLSHFDPRGLAAVRSTGELIVAGQRLHHFLPMTYAREDAAPALCLYNPVTKTFLVAGGSGEVYGATEGGGEGEGEQDAEGADDDGEGKSEQAQAVEVEAVDGGEGEGPKEEDASTKSKRGGSLRVFSALSGAELKPLRSITRTPITAIGADDRLRKLILGTQDGGITVVNAASGALMKRADVGHRRGSEVSALAYTDLDGDRSFVTVGWDRSMRIYDESLPHACVCLRSVSGTHRSDILAVDQCRHPLRLVASGDAHGYVFVHDHESLSEEGHCMGHEGEITGLYFIRPFPLLLGTDAGGNIVLWGVRGSGDGYQDSPCMVFRNRRDDKRGDLEHLVQVAEQRQEALREERRKRRKPKRGKSRMKVAEPSGDAASGETEPEAGGNAPKKSVSSEGLMLGPTVAVCSTAVGYWPFIDSGNDEIAAGMHASKEIVDDPVDSMWSREEHPLITDDAKEWAKAGIKADLPSGADGTIRKDPFKVKEDNEASSSDSDDADEADGSEQSGPKGASGGGKPNASHKMAKSAAARFSPMAHDPKRPWKSRCRSNARRTVVVGDEDGRIKVLDLSWMLKVVGCSPVSSAKDVIGIRRSSIVAMAAGKDIKEVVAAQLASQGIPMEEQQAAIAVANELEPAVVPSSPTRGGHTRGRPAASSVAVTKGLAHQRLAGRRRRSMQLQDGSLVESLAQEDAGGPAAGTNGNLMERSAADAYVPMSFAEDDEGDPMDSGDGDYMTAGARAALSEGVRQHRAVQGELVTTGSRRGRAMYRAALGSDGSKSSGYFGRAGGDSGPAAAGHAAEEKARQMRHVLLAADRTRSVPVLAQWMAHPGSSVVQVQCIADPPAICSCSADGSVKLWRPDGLPLGSLLYSPLEAYQIRIGAMPATPWRFELNKDVEQYRKDAEARRLLRVMRRRARARHETAMREAARASAMQKASKVLAVHVPTSPLLDVAKRSSAVDHGKVVEVAGDSLVDSSAKGHGSEKDRPQSKSRPSTAGSADEIAKWEGIAKADETRLKEESLAVQIEEEHERKLQHRMAEARQANAKMEQLRIAAGLSHKGTSGRAQPDLGSPDGEVAHGMVERLSHFEGSFRDFAKAREKAKGVLSGDKPGADEPAIVPYPRNPYPSSPDVLYTKDSKTFETLGTALRRIASMRHQPEAEREQEKKRSTVQRALGELEDKQEGDDESIDAGDESDDSVQAAVFSPDQAARSRKSQTVRKESTDLERKQKAEKEKQEQEERDRRAASGLFDDISGTKYAELDAEAIEAAEAIKALGSERAAGNMLMHHLMSGHAPVIHERYYPNLMDSISKLPSGGAGYGAPSQRSSEATASAHLTAAEGFGGLPVLPGRPGIPGMPLPRGFHAGGYPVGQQKESKQDANDALDRAAPMSPFLRERLSELKGSKTNRTKSGKRKRGAPAAGSGIVLAGSASAGASRFPKAHGKAYSMFIGKPRGLGRSGTFGLDMKGVTRVSEAGMSFSSADGFDDVHQLGPIQEESEFAPARHLMRGPGSVPTLKKYHTMAKSMSKRKSSSLLHESTKLDPHRSDQAVDDLDDKWAMDMWTFSSTAYAKAANAIRKSKRVDSSRKRVLLRWFVYACTSSGMQADTLKALEPVLLGPVHDFYRSTNRLDARDAIHERYQQAQSGFKYLKTGSLTLLSSGEAVALQTAVLHSTGEDLRCRLTNRANFALHFHARSPSKPRKSLDRKQTAKPGRLPALEGEGGVLLGAPGRKSTASLGPSTVTFAPLYPSGRERSGSGGSSGTGQHERDGEDAEAIHGMRTMSSQERMNVLKHASNAARVAHDSVARSADPLAKLRASSSAPDLREGAAGEAPVLRGGVRDRVTGVTDREILRATRVGGVPVAELQEAYLLFSRLDKDSSGTIDPQELLDSKVWLAPSQARVIEEARDEAARHRALEHRMALEDAASQEGEEPVYPIGVKDVYGDAGEPPTDAARAGMLTASSRLAELLSAHASSIFRSMDTNADGEISLKEYLSALFKSKAAPTAAPKSSLLASRQQQLAGSAAHARGRGPSGSAGMRKPTSRVKLKQGSRSPGSPKKAGHHGGKAAGGRRSPISRWGGSQSSQQRGLREMLQWVRARQAQASKASSSGIWNR